MPVVLPGVIANGDLEDADVLMAYILALAAKFDASITAADISNGAAIRGGGTSRQLSTAAGERVDNAALENEAVDDRVLAFDAASPGADAGRAVSGDHITTLTAAQLARILPAMPLAGIGLDKLKLTVHSVAFATASIAAGFYNFALVTPTIAFPKATYQLVGLTIRNETRTGSGNFIAAATSDDTGTNWVARVRASNDTSAGVVSGTLDFVFLSKT